VLEQITPVLLTFNEAPNLPRTLAALSWAQSIVVVDSGSRDGTLALLQADPRVHVFHRAFDSHAAQWNYAVGETGIATPWILALDADYVLSPALIAELGALRPAADTGAYRARFDFHVRGRRLWGSLYPPVTVLFRAGQGRYVQDGHTQRLEVTGRVADLDAPIAHDDRKSFAHWRQAQRRYCRLEADKLLRTPWRALGWPDRVRRLVVVAPAAVLLYCLIGRGGILQGLAGWQYALQRAWSEAVLSQEMLKRLLGVAHG
jgi:glycosyltransferase involved in cell wall biosynthesis